MACCHSDLGSAGSDVWRPVLFLWLCPLLPWQLSEVESVANFLQAAGHVGTPKMAYHCRLERRGKYRTTLPTMR